MKAILLTDEQWKRVEQAGDIENEEWNGTVVRDLGNAPDFYTEGFVLTFGDGCTDDTHNAFLHGANGWVVRLLLTDGTTLEGELSMAGMDVTLTRRCVESTQ